MPLCDSAKVADHSSDTTQQKSCRNHVAGYPALKYTRPKTIKHWLTVYVVQLMRERNIEATMEWEQDEQGFETLIVTPLDSDNSGENERNGTV